MKIQQIIEHADYPLFHGSPLFDAMDIVDCGYIRSSLANERTEGIVGISMSRSQREAEKFALTGGPVFVFSRRQLSTKFRIRPFNYFPDDRHHGFSESEEIVLTKKLPLDPYLEQIRISDRDLDWWTERFDRGFPDSGLPEYRIEAMREQFERFLSNPKIRTRWAR